MSDGGKLSHVARTLFCFLACLCKSSMLGFLWEFHGMWAEKEGELRTKKTLNSTREKKRGGERGKNVCSNLDLNIFGGSFLEVLSAD